MGTSWNKVFYKIIPLASLYYANQFDTSNIYDVPAFYNYGYGSAGINPWRELITHIKTTNWVITGEIENFPLLYHHRIVHDVSKNFNSGLDEKLMKRFGNNNNIKKYLEDRYNSNMKIILFLEHIPYVLYKYLETHQDHLDNLEKQIINVLNFLHSKDILHMDAHFKNYLVDTNGIIYLTDFGLILDKKYKLSIDESEFMNKNIMLPYFYLYDSIYTSYYHLTIKNTQLRDLLDELKQKVSKVKFAEIFIEKIDIINKITDLNEKYIKMIKNNKNYIIDTIQLKTTFDQSNDNDKKKVFLQDDTLKY